MSLSTLIVALTAMGTELSFSCCLQRSVIKVKFVGKEVIELEIPGADFNEEELRIQLLRIYTNLTAI